MSRLLNVYESLATRLGVWNYHRVWTAYLITVSFIGALLIMCCDRITFTNAFFLTSSAVTGTGLISVPMSSLSLGSLLVILFCVFFGNGVVLLIPGLLYRQYKFRQICDEGGSAVLECRAYSEYRKIYDAIGATVTALRIYIVLFQVGGTFLYFFSLLTKPVNPALEEAGFSQFTDAVFTVNSAFCNAGYTLTDTGISWQAGNAFSYLVLCVIMIGGNLGTPFIFRSLVKCIVKVHHATGSPHLAVPYEYMLANPKQVSTHMYNPVETNFIMYIFLAWTILPYCIYLASSLNDSSVLATEGYDQSQVAGVGFFNIINTRHSGFNLVNDLTELDAGVLVMYVVLMSLPTLPFIAAIFVDGDMNKPDLMCDKSYVMYQRNLRDIFGPYAKSVQVFLDTYVFQHNTYILVAYMFLAYTENGLMKETNQYTNLFSLLFEVISAYGNVGLSLVAPTVSTSFSGEFSTLGRWIIIWVMMFGKHKGLPELYDEAVDFHFKELREAGMSNDDYSSGGSGRGIHAMEMSILPTREEKAEQMS